MCSSDLWVLLFPVGQNELEGEGSYLVDEESFALVQAEFARRGLDLVIDYEHQTLGDGPAPAAGWVRELVFDPAAGILARVEWTDRATGHLSAREYRYFSPVFWVDKKTGRLCGLHSVALTNTPKHNRQLPLVAKHQPVEGCMDILKKLAALLGLPEDATEEAVLAAVGGLAEGAGSVPEAVPLRRTARTPDSRRTGKVADKMLRRPYRHTCEIGRASCRERV